MKLSKADLTWETNRANISAESNSSLGIVCSTSGATLVFDVTNLRYVPSGISILKYTTAAYPLTDASQTPCELTDTT